MNDIKWNIITYPSVNSTNALASELIQQGKAKDRDVIITQNQTQGKGQQGRVWEFFTGNLAFSAVIQVQSMDVGKWIMMVTALALVKTILAYPLDSNVDPTITIKWPNDILVNDKKLAGILTETQTGYTKTQGFLFFIVGIGLNIVQSPKEIGISLKDFCSTAPSASIFLKQFLQEFLDVEAWLLHSMDRVVMEWNKYCWKIGESVVFQAPNEEPIRGIIEGLDREGNLIFMGKGGKRIPIYSGQFLKN